MSGEAEGHDPALPDDRSPRPLSAEAVLSAQKHALELVVQGAPVADVLAALVRTLEESTGDALAAIFVFDEHGRLRAAAAPSFPDSFRAAIATSTAADFGAFAVAAATGVTAVSQDIAADPSWAVVRPTIERLGIQAVWSHPLTSRDHRVLGAFSTFFRERRRPSGLELRLVETLSQTAALAIVHHDTEAALARQRRTLDLAMEAAEMGSWRYTVADDICLYDERAQRLYGLSDGRFLHDEAGVRRMIHPDDQAPMWAAVKAACDPAGDGRYNVDYRVRQPDGSWRWLSALGVVEFEGEGHARRPVAIAGASRDISPRKRAEEQQRLLVNELNHRVKNTLATVQSIAVLTMRGPADGATMLETFEARLSSLSRAHDLLTTRNWAGADLAAVVRQALEPFAIERFDIEGAPLEICPQHALALSMALHELATNAAKYGALAAPAGRVAIAWSVEEGMLAFTWRETGGAPVTAPTRRGFGTRLLAQAVARDLDGPVRLDYAPSGVTWDARVRL